MERGRRRRYSTSETASHAGNAGPTPAGVAKGFSEQPTPHWFSLSQYQALSRRKRFPAKPYRIISGRCAGLPRHAHRLIRPDGGSN